MENRELESIFKDLKRIEIGLIHETFQKNNSVKYKENNCILDENQGFLLNKYSSDKNMIKHQKEIRLKEKVKEIKSKIGNDLQNYKKSDKIKYFNESNKNSCDKNEIFKKGYKLRATGFHDLEMKYYGKPLPCNRCLTLLQNNQSSYKCENHGKKRVILDVKKELPKRFQCLKQ